MWPNLMIPVLGALLAAPPAPRSPTPDPAAVKDQMVSALEATITTQPLLASPAAFRDPANAKTITRALRALTVMPHSLYPSRGQASPTSGVETLYGDQLERASADYAKGNFEAARQRLKNVTALCLACHIRQPRAPRLEEATSLVDTMKVQPLDRARYYAATRQYDRALQTWRSSLKEARTDSEAYEQSQAARVALDVAVRGKDDPRAALTLIESQLGRRDYPHFVNEQLERAGREVRAWNAEHFSVATASSEELLTRARGLIEVSGAARTVASDDLHIVSLMRAAGYLDEALHREPNARWRGEALYLLGVVSPSVNPPLLWQLEPMYLEACIRENPRSAIARQCWNRLYSRTWFSYGGYVNIPAEELRGLTDLRRLVP